MVVTASVVGWDGGHDMETRLPLTETFEEALTFAARRHAQQIRKGSDIPYISHLLQVAGLVLEYGGNETQAVAALLHDAVEDRAAKIEEIGELFGAEVAAVVEGCSDTARTEGEKEPWLERKRAYIDRIGQEPETARLVSAADKLHNARAILQDCRIHGDALFDR